MKLKLSCVAAMLFTFAFATAAQAASFLPISSVSSSTDATDLWPVSNLIQGPGVGIDASAPHDKISGGSEGNWVTADPGGFPSDYIEEAGAPVIVFDMGADVSLSEISTWGYSVGNTNGVSEFSLRFATEAEGTGAFGSSIAFNPTFNMTIDDTVRQSNPFSQTVVARYVEFTASDNFFLAPGDGTGHPDGLAGGDRVGLGEVAFAVPEPASVALMLLAFSALACQRKK